METALLILRWAVAIFLFYLAAALPVGFWKRKEPGRSDWMFMGSGLIIAGIAGTAGFGLITWNWQPLWFTVRCAFALIFAVLAISVALGLHRGGEQTTLFRWIFFCLGCALIMPAVSLVLLDWRWLLASGGFLVLIAALMIPAEFRKQMRETGGHWERWAKSRKSVLTSEEANPRPAPGETPDSQTGPTVRSGAPQKIWRED